MALDDFLIDKLVQPVVDALPEGVTCFDIATWANRVFLLSVDINLVLSWRTEWYFWKIVCIVFWPIYYLLLQRTIDKAARTTKARPGFMNPLRFDTSHNFELYWFLSILCIRILTFLFGPPANVYHLPFNPDMWSIILAILFMRAQPRPPGRARKSFLPSFNPLDLAPQGAA